jgi:hypothetical protein
MYLWKGWRDARLSVAIFVVPFVFEIYNLLRHAPAVIGPSQSQSIEWMLTHFVSISGILLLFVGWSLGGDGIGQDIAEDQGAFMLTRPRTRRFFVWSDSGFSFGLMAVLAWATMLLFELVSLLHIIVFQPPRPRPAALTFVLIPLCGVVFAGLVYGVTYLCTMLIPRHNTARVISVAVLIGYTYLHFKSLGWEGVAHNLFPSWWVDPFPYRFSSAVAPHVWLELGGRVVAIVVLLLAAQFVLERREIRA